ncbi:hypothetical protein ABZ714_14340 [Streptomyces sp. NPDC006798]|uniref:VG15 protein n=1 Tax=unclassified Streptomyces TaxID=2593676 RepID=UPI00340F05CA
MASAIEVTEFRIAQAGIVLLAQEELNAFLLSLDYENPTAVINALLLYMPELVSEYGEIGAAVAVDYYDELREQSSADTDYGATMATLPLAAAVQGSVRWAAGPLFLDEPDPIQLAKNLNQINDRFVKMAARDTISLSAAKDPSKARYARVPSGGTTCKYCLMLASRGAVYADSKKAAEANKFHGNCDCQMVPMWDGDDYPRGYSPEELYDQYKALEDAEKASKT